jgi:peptidoglycan/xylan/chitin deacetylase (PgdA/CDA1 family)
LTLKQVAIITTALVIVAGFAMISPLFIRADETVPKQKVLLTFSVAETADAVAWCQNLASLLDDYNIGAAVFIPGRLAEQHPEAIWDFDNNVDIGSQTYSNADLTKISDYSIKLQEVEEGKMAVDEAAGLDTKMFRAPFFKTDQDIYSILSRSGILADFSYENQYHIYVNGKFLTFDVKMYKGSDYSPEFFSTLPTTSEPFIIDFDNSYSIFSLQNFFSGLNMEHFEFVNASQFVGFTLTNRK